MHTCTTIGNRSPNLLMTTIEVDFSRQLSVQNEKTYLTGQILMTNLIGKVQWPMAHAK